MTKAFLLALVLFASMVVPLAVMVGHMRFRAWRARRIGLRHPIGSDLLRPAGHSTSVVLDDARIDLMTVLTTSLVVGCVAAIFAAALPAALSTTTSLVMAALVWLSGMTYVVRDTLKTLARIRNLRLGWEGELAAAEELNRLMRDGYHVFHDVPADGFNIDHVVVGPSGVFAVETKTRTKRRREREKDHIVRYNGKELLFAGRSEVEPLNQAKRQAVWLSKWLRGNLGEAVEVIPAVTIPGWYVELTARGDVVVFQPKLAKQAIVQSRRGAPLDSAKIERAAFALDRVCRSLEPRTHLL